MSDASESERVISFGPFRLLPAQRLLLQGDEPVRLGSRAFDILIALVERPGELVGKRELISLVWPNTVVVDGNLTVHVAALRQALRDGQAGNRYILNIPGRGYRFLAPVAVAEQQRPAAIGEQMVIPPSNLPSRLTRLIGRDEIIHALARQLSLERLLTIVGPGGIGKTAVALSVAHEMLPVYAHGVWLIDLAPIADSSLVPAALAATLRLEIRSDDPLAGIIGAIRDKQMLLVLDNCEHVIGDAANLAASILRSTRGVAFLATSREPLRVDGERVHRLPPLENPPALMQLTASEALRFPAVQLFVERAMQAMSNFSVTDADAASAGEICRKLDGIALAIELAAARVETFGLRGLAVRLDDRLRLLTGGRRIAVPRHRTVRAMLDWSYHLLTPAEQAVFRRLAIFAAGFSSEAARTVAADWTDHEGEIFDHLTELIAKSLLMVEVSDAEPRFRLLETTREYALDKLAESGERDQAARRHAKYCRTFFEQAQAEWEARPTEDRMAEYGRHIDDLRAALKWAFSSGGDRSLTVALAAASVPVWLEMSLLTECHESMSRALECLDGGDRETRREMVIQYALGVSLMFTRGTDERARAALTRASELAEGFRDVDYLGRALTGLALFCIRLEEFRSALTFARRSEEAARGSADPIAIAAADAVLSSSLATLGDYAGALVHARRTDDRRLTPGMRRVDFVRSGIDHSIEARCIIAHALWQLGLLDQSARVTQAILADAEAGGHPVSLCFALVWCGSIVSLGRGDLQTAERSIAQLKDYAGQHALSGYYACGLGFEGQLCAQRGAFANAEQLLRAALDKLRRARYEILYTPFLTWLGAVVATEGRYEDGLVLIDDALQRIEQSGGLWWLPEALRIRGEVLLRSNSVEIEQIEALFRRSLDLACRQGALFGELLAAMSLGRLCHVQGHTEEARDLLSLVYGRFGEGLDAPVLQSARDLLTAWTAGTAGEGPKADPRKRGKNFSPITGSRTGGRKNGTLCKSLA